MLTVAGGILIAVAVLFVGSIMVLMAVNKFLNAKTPEQVPEPPKDSGEFILRPYNLGK